MCGVGVPDGKNEEKWSKVMEMQVPGMDVGVNGNNARETKEGQKSKRRKMRKMKIM